MSSRYHIARTPTATVDNEAASIIRIEVSPIKHKIKFLVIKLLILDFHN